jgi:hypothetical protein
MGEKVRVRVASANLDKRRIDYSIMGMPVAADKPGKRSAPSKVPKNFQQERNKKKVKKK